MSSNPVTEAAVGAIVFGAFVKILPPLAALMAIVWYGVQMWQSETGKNWRARWKRLFLRRKLSVEDKILFLLILMFGGSGLAILYAVGRFIPFSPL